MHILSIQSHVAYGHVGNSAAVFPMQRLGVDVWPVLTVQFSNHTGYGAWTGQVFDGAMIESLIRGVEARGVLSRCDGVLSGYAGSAEIGEAVLGAVARVRAANPAALYCCDPVMGDVGRGVFVRPDVPEFMRLRAMPAADILTPNQFELEMLTGRAVGSLAEARAAVRVAHGLGPSVILLTSLQVAETPADAIEMLASGPEGMWRVRTPKLGRYFTGAGDVTAALFFTHYLRTRSVAAALEACASSVHGLLAATAASGDSELQVVQAQEEFVSPSRIFGAEPL
ncbi:pyridoxal kinase PdxY [Camelimonas abortus]|uniref:pyridoxal kinase n=1 Tax=Camelimonas abortus TaxID=1017184 RepID=A0ABV7LGT9_9HYPH